MGNADSEWALLRGRHAPSDDDWQAVKSRLCPGDRITGTVLSHHRFGMFLDIGQPALALVEVPFIRELDVSITMDRQLPQIGSTVAAVILGFPDLQRQVRVSMRASDGAAARGDSTPPEGSK